MFKANRAWFSASSRTSLDTEASPFIESEEKTLPENVHHPQNSFKNILKSYFWVVITFILALSQIVTLIQLRQLQRIGTYETGFGTDLEPARVAMALKQRYFTGGLSLDASGKLFREQESGQAQYVGYPAPEIDDAWHDMLRGTEIVLSGKDATDVVRSSIEEPQGGAWRVELEVFHSLHCVNHVRKAIDVEYYFPNNTMPSIYRVHTDHCLDYLRQVVQCQSDMTPMTFYWNEQIKTYLPNFEHAHTCRDFDKVKQWAMLHRATTFATISMTKLKSSAVESANLGSIVEQNHPTRAGKKGEKASLFRSLGRKMGKFGLVGGLKSLCSIARMIDFVVGREHALNKRGRDGDNFDIHKTGCSVDKVVFRNWFKAVSKRTYVAGTTSVESVVKSYYYSEAALNSYPITIDVGCDVARNQAFGGNFRERRKSRGYLGPALGHLKSQ